MRSRNERQDSTGPGRPRTRGRRGLRTLVAAAGVAVAAVTMLVPSAGPAAAETRTVEIVNETGLRADVVWASKADLTRVFLYGNNASASQEFNILDGGNGYFRIQARHSGKCLMLDWRSGSYSNGTAVLQYGCQAINYGPGEWRVIKSGCVNAPGLFCQQRQMLQNRKTGRCLDAANPNGQPARYSYLQQWDCIRTGLEWNWKNQDFYLVNTVPYYPPIR